MSHENAWPTQVLTLSTKSSVFLHRKKSHPARAGWLTMVSALRPSQAFFGAGAGGFLPK